MTISEAIKSMQEGNKVTHIYYPVSYYTYMKDWVVYDKKGNIIRNFTLFTAGNNLYETGWSIYKEQNC